MCDLTHSSRSYSPNVQFRHFGYLQVCSNGTRVFVQKKVMKTFLEKLVSRTMAMKVGDPFAEDTTVGATISRQQGDKVLQHIDLAKKEV